jgi:hypothetical protein
MEIVNVSVWSVIPINSSGFSYVASHLISFSILLRTRLEMKLSLAVLGGLALAHAAPTAEIKPIEKRITIGDAFSSQVTGAFVELLKDVAHIVKDLTAKTHKPVPSATSFRDWKTFKANGVNLGGWLGM